MGNELPRLFHHLGPRYLSNFQSSPLVRFFTYEAATSLSIYLQSLIDAKRTPSAELSVLLKGAKDGPGIPEDSIVFALTPAGYQPVNPDTLEAVVLNSALRKDRIREAALVKGDVAVVKPQCLDVSVWKMGGAAIPLRLVELSQARRFRRPSHISHSLPELARFGKRRCGAIRQSPNELAEFGRHGENTRLRDIGPGATVQGSDRRHVYFQCCIRFPWSKHDHTRVGTLGSL